MIELKNAPFAIPTFDLTGKVAIVTGGTKGLGNAMCITLAAYGAKVIVSSRSQDECDALAAEIKAMGGEATGVKCDVCVEAEIDALVDKAVEIYGKLDVMVSNAGLGITKRAVEMTVEEWDTVIDTNLRGVFLCGRAAARHMIERGEGGRVINIASAGGLVGTKNIASYCASKAGVVSLSKTMAMEWGTKGITVNTICPGYVPTSINKKPLEIPKVREQIIGRTALKRLGTPEEIAAVVVFLASDASSIMTGAYIAADMGTTCN